MAFPTAEEVMLRFRREVDDRLSDPTDTSDDADRLWENAEIYQYMNEAQYEVARATRGLLRNSTLAVTAGNPYVTVYGLLEVLSLESASTYQRLEERNDSERVAVGSDYGISYASFSDSSTGTPRYYSLDKMANRIRLTPVPVADDTFNLTAIALPRTEIEDGDDELPFSDPKDIRLVLHYMKALAYDKQDTDVLDRPLSEAFRAKFTLEAAERELELERLRSRPRAVRFSY